MVKPHRLREATGAHYGLGDWLAQRLTAIVMTVYTLAFAAIVLWRGGMDFAQWKELFAGGVFRVFTFLFVVSLLYHAWVGVRNISMDYVKPLGVRLGLQTIVIALAVAYLGWTVGILWGGTP
jgi:succinate dehydrogenase / fumarate reductase membrane anchor subunit